MYPPRIGLGSDATTRPRSRAGGAGPTPSSDGATGRTTTTTAATTPEGGTHDEIKPTPTPTPRKRKLVEEDGDGHAFRGGNGDEILEDLFRTSIVLKPYPPNLTIKPRVLQPLMVLPRAHLALSYLDLASPTADLPCTGPSRLVESHIRILDLEQRLGASSTTGAPSVLIARSDSTGAVYAMDRHEGNLYAACRLGKWVALEELRHKAVAFSKRLLARDRGMGGGDGNKLGDDGSREVVTPAMQRAQKKKRVAIEEFQSLVKKRARSQSVSRIGGLGMMDADAEMDADEGEGEDRDVDGSTLVETQPGISTQIQEPVSAPAPQLPTPAPAPLGEPTAPSGPGELLENIRTQYLETLYKSMGSLAYFAKGPLSRARAMFHLDDEAALEMKDLVDFLKSLVLTTVQIDTKYRETMPDIIGQMKTYVDSSEEGRKSRKRKAKKMRVGKNGLYPAEDELVRKWWLANKPVVEEDDETTAVSVQQVRSHASLLRTRETQLQMILILEILALEPACAAEKEGESQLPGQTPLPAEPLAAPTPKKRSKHNLPVLLDLHADRLCIWQSTAFEEHALLQGSIGGGQDGPDGAPGQTSSSEPLRDFCVDIIIPFFSARLPDVCKTINRKLGGPKIVSKDKARLARASGSTKRDPKPGAATKRPIRANPARSAHNLERALSKEMQSRRSESRGPPTALELMRSATATAVIPNFKREGSAPALKREASESQLLGMAPRAVEPRNKAMPRGSNIFGRSTSFTNLDDLRAKRQAVSQAELQEAISGIRRPNRQRAGKAIVEAAERRVAAGIQKKPGRSGLATSTVIEATPVNVRFKNVFAKPDSQFLAGRSTIHEEEYDDDDAPIPPSSISRIPDTATRPGYRDAVLATPCGARRHSTTMPALDAIIPPSSPLLARAFGSMDPDEFTVPDSMVKKSRENRRPLTHVANRSIFETPTKTRPRSAVGGGGGNVVNGSPPPLLALGGGGGNGSPVAPGGGGGVKNKSTGGSIYQRLGWDDDDDDELLG